MTSRSKYCFVIHVRNTYASALVRVLTGNGRCAAVGHLLLRRNGEDNADAHAEDQYQYEYAHGSTDVQQQPVCVVVIVVSFQCS